MGCGAVIAAASILASVRYIRADGELEGKVAFPIGVNTDPSGNADWRIGVVNADGSGDILLLPWPADDIGRPTWSPDASRIAYAGALGLWVVSLDGKLRRRIVQWESYQFYVKSAWSPNGASIAFDAERVALVPPSGGRPQMLNVSGSEPEWSPDGTRIAVVDYESDPGSQPVKTEIFVVATRGQERRRLTHSGDRPRPDNPAWSPDGMTIAFERSRGADEPESIHAIDVDGNGERLLGLGADPSWSPDGEHIVFELQERRPAVLEAGESAIWIMKADGTDRRRLWPREGLCDCSWPAWSPK